MSLLHIGEHKLLIHFGMPMSTASVAESAQSVIQSGSRLLLMIAATLFLAYLLFLVTAVMLSSAVTKMIAFRHRPAAKAPALNIIGATVTPLPLPADDGWGNRHETRADGRALSA